MNRKNKTVTFVLQLIIILLFFTMLCFPLTLMALDGPDNTEIESEAATELLPLNLRNYVLVLGRHICQKKQPTTLPPPR